MNLLLFTIPFGDKHFVVMMVVVVAGRIVNMFLDLLSVFGCLMKIDKIR